MEKSERESGFICNGAQRESEFMKRLFSANANPLNPVQFLQCFIFSLNKNKRYEMIIFQFKRPVNIVVKGIGIAAGGRGSISLAGQIEHISVANGSTLLRRFGAVLLRR